MYVRASFTHVPFTSMYTASNSVHYHVVAHHSPIIFVCRAMVHEHFEAEEFEPTVDLFAIRNQGRDDIYIFHACRVFCTFSVLHFTRLM